MKIVVVVVGVVNATVLGLLVYAYLWVLDVAFDPGGVTSWENPPRVAVLTILALGAAAVAASVGTRLFRSGHDPRERLAVYGVASTILIGAGLLVVFDAVVTQT